MIKTVGSAWIAVRGCSPFFGVEREDDPTCYILMLLANVRGGINRLMAEVLEDHIRLHLLSPEGSPAQPGELAEI